MKVEAIFRGVFIVADVHKLSDGEVASYFVDSRRSVSKEELDPRFSPIVFRTVSTV